MTPRPRKATTKTPAASAEGAVAVVAPPDGPDAALAAAEETPPGTAVPGTESDPEAGGPGAGFSLVRVVDVAMVLPNPNPVLVLEELATPRGPRSATCYVAARPPSRLPTSCSSTW
jgi:hypothetical protein